MGSHVYHPDICIKCALDYSVTIGIVSHELDVSVGVKIFHLVKIVVLFYHRGGSSKAK